MSSSAPTAAVRNHQTPSVAAGAKAAEGAEDGDADASGDGRGDGGVRALRDG